MSVNFTRIDQMKVFCQKILPLVYDDSLSYYEMLCRVQAVINQLIENNNQIPEYIAELISDERITGILQTLLNNLEEQIAIANEKDSKTATAPRHVGELVWLDGKLFRIIHDMIAGDQYFLNSNCVKTTIEDEISRVVETEIAPLIEALNEEIETRSQADEVLQSDIETEITARTQGDEELQSNIETEVTARENAVNELTERINNIKLSGLIDVTKFGVVGDGVTDDSEALQNIIDSVTSSGTLVLPYNCKMLINNKVTVNKPIRFLGNSGKGASSGVGATVILGEANDGFDCTSLGVCFDNISFTCNTPKTKGTMIIMHVGQSVINNCRFKNWFTAISCDNTSGLSITNCFFIDGADGSTYNSTAIYIGKDVYCAGIYIDNCHFTNYERGARYFIRMKYVDGIEINACEMIGRLIGSTVCVLIDPDKPDTFAHAVKISNSMVDSAFRGIYIAPNTETVYTHIVNNFISAMNDSGLFITAPDNASNMRVVIANNNILNCQGYGIYLQKNTYYTNIVGNNISNCSEGVHAENNCHHIAINSNVFAKSPNERLNLAIALIGTTSNITLTGNISTSATTSDCYVSTTSTNTIKHVGNIFTNTNLPE